MIGILERQVKLKMESKLKSIDVLHLIDATDLAIEKLEDARYLMQAIQEEYFDAFDGHKKEDEWCIACEHNRYAAFFRILTLSVDDIYETLKNAELKKKTAELALETVNQ